MDRRFLLPTGSIAIFGTWFVMTVVDSCCCCHVRMLLCGPICRLCCLVLSRAPDTVSRPWAIEDVIVNLTADDWCPEYLRSYAHKFGEKYLVD